MTTRIRSFRRAAVLAASIGWAVPATAQEEPPAAPGTVPVPAVEAKVTNLPWWQIPRPARVALRRMAASEDAVLTKCVLIERDGTLIYEFHASKWLGPFRHQDYVLTGFSEPAEVAEARRRGRSLPGRIEKLRRSLRPEPSPTINP